MSIETKLKKILAPVLQELIELHELDAETEQYNKDRGYKRNINVFVNEEGQIGFMYCSMDNPPYAFIAEVSIKKLKQNIKIINQKKEAENE
ncbi:hypothetical protein [Bernardetia sp. MNP-M8]|uniref:hypothetical protein n=1 Tax=Bernardetia sp. MNP-M8 TaxID=3127470 RepID=UPI0030CF2FD6